ncbi:MAG: DUF1848 domain-containing protein, partial [Blautia sp.]|nr:DUF1848 domain-containing protein [Blautia sp.]
MIISASRRTDIPAFYHEWFLHRIEEGFLVVRNPMNNQPLRILLSPDIVDCIVFWTKNPSPMLKDLSRLKDYSYYFQFTLTGYGRDVEKALPDKKKVLIPAFQKLSDAIGPERVIWRYDPILVNERYSISYHLKAIEQIAGALKGYTHKCVFSFVDTYVKNSKALKALGVEHLSTKQMREMATQIRDITAENDMVCATCAEEIDLEDLHIEHNACIDKNLIERLTGGTIHGTKKNLKDSGQREACRCMASKDVGLQNSCAHGCVYCYANFSPQAVSRQMQKYDPHSVILC